MCGAHAMAVSQSAIDSRQASRFRHATGAWLFWSQRRPIVGEKLPLRLVVRTDYSGAILIDVLKLVPNLKDAPGEKCFRRVVNEVSTHCNDSCRRRAGACAGCPQTGHAFGIDNGRHFRSFRRIISSQDTPDCADSSSVNAKLRVLSCGDNICAVASNGFVQHVAADGEGPKGRQLVEVRPVGKVLSNTFS